MMKNISPKQKSQSKGMIVATVFGLLAIGTAAFIGIKNTESKISTDEQTPQITDQTASIPDESEEWRSAASSGETEEQEYDSEQTMTAPKEETEKEKAKTNTLTGFVLPVDGEIITPYSNGEMVKSLTLNDWRTHDGIDIAAAESTPVKACNSGKIESVEIDPMWGTTVVISHTDGTKSYYMGLDKNVPVTKGQQVALGEVIGAVGNTAEIEQALESHLHFAMKQDGNWIDPVKDTSADK